MHPPTQKIFFENGSSCRLSTDCVSLSWLVAVLSCNVYKCFSKYWSANATKPNRVNTRLCLYLTTLALFRLRTAFSLEDESSGPDRTGRDQTGWAPTRPVWRGPTLSRKWTGWVPARPVWPWPDLGPTRFTVWTRWVPARPVWPRWFIFQAGIPQWTFNGGSSWKFLNWNIIVAMLCVVMNSNFIYAIYCSQASPTLAFSLVKITFFKIRTVRFIELLNIFSI